ncbi:2-amino-4-hydroxy-6-hydroxymethyldihydropteridine diphosphokinase [bacterium]|nr:2-amino-4-hydroxy-6-hydroxymethyldihydropteridine diphosphokinase [bacterium]
MIEHAYIGFGSNLGDRTESFEHTYAELEQRVGILRVSSVVESRPAENVEGGSFLNAVFECPRMGGAPEFLRTLQSIEQRLGGVTDKQGAARACDLDLLLWGETVLDSEELTLPHPRLHLRDFYLGPLCELIPSETHPRLRVRFIDLLKSLEHTNIIRSLDSNVP